MIWYIVIFGILIMLDYIGLFLSKVHFKIVLFFIFVLFSCFVGLRGDIDSDYSTYQRAFESINLGADGSEITFEYSFYIISKLASNLVGKYWLVTFIYSTLTFFFLILRLYTFKNISILAIIVYYSYFFFLQSITQIRAGIGIVLLIYGIKFIKDRNLLAYVITILIASFFHVSCLLFLVAYFMDWKKNNSIKNKIIIVVSTIALIKYFQILSLIFLFIPDSESLVVIKLLSHQNTLDNGIGNRTADIFFVVILFKLIFNFFLHSFEKKIVMNEPYFILLTKIHFFGCILFIIFSDMHIIAARVSDIFIVFEILLIPMVIHLLGSTKGRVFVYILSLFQLIITLNFINQDFIKPYKLVFF